MDIGKVHFFEVQLEALCGIFKGGLWQDAFPGVRAAGEIVGDELVVPDGIVALQFDGRVFQADVLELGLILEEPPVGDVDFNGSGIEQSVLFGVLYQGALQDHFIEEREVDFFDADSGMKIV